MKKIISLLLLLCSALIMHAQRNCDDVIEAVKANNSELKALRAEQAANFLERRAENTLADPEIEFGRVWGTNTPENKWDLSVTQSFDFPWIYSARKHATDARKQYNDMAYMAAENEKILQAKELIIELAYCDKSIKIHSEVVENLSKVVTLLQKAFENGEVTILDVNKTRIEYANARMKLADIHTLRTKLSSQLCVLAGIESVGKVEFFYQAESLMPKDVYISQLYDNPLVAQYDELRRVALLDHKVASLGYLPDISVGYLHEREGSDSFDGFKVGLALPFFSNRFKKQEAKYRVIASELLAQAKRDELAADIESAYENVVMMQMLLEQLAPVFNTTNHAALLYKAYIGGEISIISYLDELNYFHTSEVEFLINERDYYLELVRLNRFNNH